MRRDANAANLFALRGPRVLHLATHGLVYEGGDEEINPLLRAMVARGSPQEDRLDRHMS